jgi:xylan 1,4-beta-xylosidase
MIFQNDLVKAYFSKDGADWKKINVVAEVSSFQHNAFGGWMSLRPGVFAAGKGEVTVHKFVLRPLP